MFDTIGAITERTIIIRTIIMTKNLRTSRCGVMVAGAVLAIGLTSWMAACSDDSSGGRDAALQDGTTNGDANTGPDGGLDGTVSDGASNDGGSDACPDPVSDDYCEATGGGVCWTIDPVNGDDQAAGTYDHPWKTFVNVNTSIYTQYRPATWKGLNPGDVVYLKTGVYSAIYHPGDDGGADGGGSYVLYLRGVDGTESDPITVKGFPGAHPVIDPAGQGRGIHLLQSSYLRIEGIEVRNAYSRGVYVGECDFVRLSRLLVHDTDGTVSANVSGMEIAANHIDVSDSVFYDNYDRTAAQNDTQTGNSCNVVLFGGGDVHIHDSIFYQTADRSSPFSGCGVKYKHASRQPDAHYEIDHCYFENHKYFAIGVGTAHAHVHHNLINGAPVGIVSKDFGGPTHQYDQIFEFNTIYDAEGFFVSPTLDWVDHDNGPWPDVQDNRFSSNVVSSPMDSYTSDHRTVLLNSYMSDDLYLTLKDGIDFEDNCYFNPLQAVSFGFAGADNYGPLGAYYSLSQWQATYSWDQQSVEADPQFIDPAHLDFSLPASSPCAQWGALTDGNGVPLDKDMVFRCVDESP